MLLFIICIHFLKFSYKFYMMTTHLYRKCDDLTTWEILCSLRFYLGFLIWMFSFRNENHSFIESIFKFTAKCSNRCNNKIYKIYLSIFFFLFKFYLPSNVLVTMKENYFFIQFNSFRRNKNWHNSTIDFFLTIRCMFFLLVNHDY